MIAKNTRDKLLDSLAELGRIHPEWRLGQTLANVAMAAGRLDAGAVWDMEDEEALRAVNEMLHEHGHALNA
jgi:hypothetical protein